MRSSKYGVLLMILVSLIYGIIVISKWNTAVAYFVLLSILCLAIILSNKDMLICANNLFLAFWVYCVGLGPIFLLARGATYGYDYFVTILGAILAFGWGNAFARIRAKSIKRVDDKWKYRIIGFTRRDMLRICYGISLLASMYYIFQNREYLWGGDINANRVVAQSGNGMILYISQLPIVLVPMYYDLYFRGKVEGRRYVQRLELLIVVSISTITLLFSGFRAPVLTMYICLAISFVQKNKVNPIRIASLGVVFVVFVELLGYVRNYISASTVSITSFWMGFINSFVVNCYNLNYIHNTFPSRVPFQHGYTYLINLVMLLPGPDLDFTLWLKDKLNLTFSGGGVTPTIMGEFYINFGTSGIFVGMFLLGIVGVYVQRYYKRHSETFLGVFLVWQFAHCASGGIANVMITILLYGFVYWGLMLFPVSGKLRQRLRTV